MATEQTSEARSILSRTAKRLYSLTNGPQRPLMLLEAVERAQWMLERARDAAVAGARAEGASWGQIGRALGISRQAARQRWGPPATSRDGDQQDPWRAALPATLRNELPAPRTRSS